MKTINCGRIKCVPPIRRERPAIRTREQLRATISWMAEGKTDAIMQAVDEYIEEII